MNQLKMRNPQMYQMLSQGKINPIDILKKMTNNATPEQMQNLFTRAQNMGFPNEVLTKIQSEIGIDSKG